MNVQAARFLSSAPAMMSMCTQTSRSVPRLALRSQGLKHSPRLCGQVACLHLNKHILRTTHAKYITSSAVAACRLTTLYGYCPKLYSTGSPQETDDKRAAKDEKRSPGEVHVDTDFVENEATGEKRRKGQMNRYVRRASKATEKMKEKMADTVKDMKENIFTIPNLLSTTRLVMSPVLGYLVIQESYTLGACLFAVAGITDLLDGFIARNFKNQQSVLGSIIDPLADKCLVTILALSLTVSGLIPVPLTILMVSRDVGLVGSVFYLRYQSLPPPRTVSRFFDITHATVQLKPTTISKLNTAVQLGLVGFTLAAPVFHYVDHPLLHALWFTTAATTILSGLSYVFSKDAFKFLRK
ncbi:probable cardiolipin synthase (CMP-forming) isoform X2 [Patiria miniata]|nr:probable cardiolipin synthase (CMP-forming) isoform X2 [Patiria miniata]